MIATPRSILDFWFGEPGSEQFGQAREEWFVKSESFDGLIRSQFEPTIKAAIAGELDGWHAQDAPPSTTLAYILLMDQFTRNIYRNTPAMVSGDPGALQAARALVGNGRDLDLTVLQRVFVYLPFEHSEEIEMQEESVRLFGQIAGDPHASNFAVYAQKHYDVIARFGRFPHRNAWLGRTSTTQETEYLQEPGTGF